MQSEYAMYYTNWYYAKHNFRLNLSTDQKKKFLK